MKKDSKDSVDNIEIIKSALQLIPAQLPAEIPEKILQEAYKLLTDKHAIFSLGILVDYLNKETVKEIDFSSANFILNNPIQISGYRSCPEHLVQNAKTGSFELLFYPTKNKNKETQLIIKALIFLLRTWKTLHKQYHIKYSGKLEVKKQETAEIYFRINNRFNYKNLTDLIKDLAKLKEVNMGSDPDNKLINLKYDRLFKKDNDSIVLFREIPGIQKKLYENTQIASVRPVFTRNKGIPRQLCIEAKDFKRQLSHDEWVKDSQQKYFRRYLVRAITPQERVIIAENINLDNNIILLPPTEANKEYLENFKVNKQRSNLKNPDSSEFVKFFENPEVKSGLLVLEGRNKFAFCCSDTLKKVQILSNGRKSFINDGQALMPYIHGDGKGLPGYQVQGGGQIIIDCGLIPKDFEIIAVRANFANPNFLDEFRSNTALRIKWVSYRNHEVHLSKLPLSAIIAWRPSALSPWLNIKEIQAPLYKSRSMRKEQLLDSRTIKDIEEKLPVKIQLEEKQPEPIRLEEKKAQPKPISIDNPTMSSSRSADQKALSSPIPNLGSFQNFSLSPDQILGNIRNSKRKLGQTSIGQPFSCGRALDFTTLFRKKVKSSPDRLSSGSGIKTPGFTFPQ
jgi:hypothetical protein